MAYGHEAPPEPAVFAPYLKPIAYAAIAAIWLVWLADLAIDIRSMFDEGFWRHMAELAQWRISFASFALFAFPFVSGGLYVLNKGLRQPWLCLLLFFLFSTVCIYLHSSYFFFAHAAARHAELSGEAQAAVASLLAGYSAFKNMFGAVFMAGVLIASVWLFAVVLAGKTRFPRAFAFISPLTGVVLGRVLRAVYLPAAEWLYPVTIPAFWMALLFTVYLLYVLKLEGRQPPASA